MNLGEIGDKLECQDLLVRFCTALDSGDNAKAAAMLADDAIAVTPTGELSGAAARKMVESRPTAIITRHVMTNQIVTLTGANSASAAAYILVYRVPREPNDVVPRRLPATPQAAGDWKLEFKKTTAGWRISRYEAVPVMVPAE
jgi:hypothetical protein